MIHTAYIGVGSNIGDKLLNCKNGVVALAERQNTKIKKWSRFYRTEPVDYTDQDWFINAVVKIETDMDARQLIKEIKSIERAAGRRDTTVRFGPRILDMDILLFDDVVVNSGGLIIPHPRMHRRRFVLKPICDLGPSVVHPVLNQEMRYLLAALDEDGQRMIEYRCDF